jgi:hypothetical protein
MHPTDYDHGRAQLLEVAARVLGPERAAALEPQLAERARHLWLVAGFPLDEEDEPAWPV